MWTTRRGACGRWTSRERLVTVELLVEANQRTSSLPEYSLSSYESWKRYPAWPSVGVKCVFSRPQVHIVIDPFESTVTHSTPSRRWDMAALQSAASHDRGTGRRRKYKQSSFTEGSSFTGEGSSSSVGCSQLISLIDSPQCCSASAHLTQHMNENHIYN